MSITNYTATADGSVATGTSTGGFLSIIACDSSIFDGAIVTVELSNSTYVLTTDEDRANTLRIKGMLRVAVPEGVTWTVKLKKAVASTSLKLIVVTP